MQNNHLVLQEYWMESLQIFRKIQVIAEKLKNGVFRWNIKYRVPTPLPIYPSQIRYLPNTVSFDGFWVFYMIIASEFSVFCTISAPGLRGITL